MQQTTWEKEDRQPALQRLSPAQDQGEQRLAVNAFLTEHWGSNLSCPREKGFHKREQPKARQAEPARISRQGLC